MFTTDTYNVWTTSACFLALGILWWWSVAAERSTRAFSFLPPYAAPVWGIHVRFGTLMVLLGATLTTAGSAWRLCFDAMGFVVLYVHFHIQNKAPHSHLWSRRSQQVATIAIITFAAMLSGFALPVGTSILLAGGVLFDIYRRHSVRMATFAHLDLAALRQKLTTLITKEYNGRRFDKRVVNLPIHKKSRPKSTKTWRKSA